MLEIAICDDQKECANEVYRYVKKSLQKKNIEVHFTAFLSGKKLLASSTLFDIVFLDIEMPQMDGIEVGKKLRQTNEKCKIIMVTSLKERYKDAFHFQAFRFVTKPIEPNEIDEAILSAIQLPIGTDTICAYQNRLPYDIAMRDIDYIMAFNGYTEIYVGKNIFRREDSLMQLQNELDERIFCQISRKYIVNLQKIKVVNSNTVLIGQEELTVSTRAKKAFEKKYMEFDLNYR